MVVILSQETLCCCCSTRISPLLLLLLLLLLPWCDCCILCFECLILDLYWEFGLLLNTEAIKNFLTACKWNMVPRLCAQTVMCQCQVHVFFICCIEAQWDASGLQSKAMDCLIVSMHLSHTDKDWWQEAFSRESTCTCLYILVRTHVNIKHSFAPYSNPHTSQLNV